MRRSSPRTASALLALGPALLLVVGLGVAVAPATPASEPDAWSGPRLVILYATCTLNRGFLAPYDPSVSYTPELARFARDSVVFTKQFTEAGQSGIAFASIFSGSQADHHGVYRHPRRLEDELYLISEAYAENGYEVHFFNAHSMASVRLNYGQGVPTEHTVTRSTASKPAVSRVWRVRLRELYYDSGLADLLRPLRDWYAEWNRSETQKYLTAGDPRFAAILEGLRADENRRAFILTNFTYTHGPYKTLHVEEFLESHPAERLSISDDEFWRYVSLYRNHNLALSWNFDETIASLGISGDELPNFLSAVELLYKSNVWVLDRMFGEVVARIRDAGLQDESLIVFTADHGEILHRRSAPFKFSHGMQMVPDVLQVPLLIRSGDPSVRPGGYDAVSRSIDVFPTMAGLSGFALPAGSGVQGVDLSPTLRGLAPAPELSAFSHSSLVVRKMYLLSQHEDQARDFRVVRRYFPDEDPGWMWASLAEGDEFFVLRRSPSLEWQVEAFDLRVDPTASRDIYDPENPAHAEKARRLADYKSGLVAAYQAFREAEGKALLPEEEEEEALRALGYIR